MTALHPPEPLALERRKGSFGHEDQFRPPSLSGRCAFAEETFARTHRKEEDAPFPAVRGAAIEPLRSTPNPTFAAINGGGSPCPNCELRRLWRCNGAKW